MANCSMAPGDFDIFLQPYKKPRWLYGLLFHGARGLRYLLETRKEILILFCELFRGAGEFWYLLKTLSSMGPGNFDIFLKPYKKPYWLYG